MLALLLLGGLLLLVAGGELLVRGASRLASALGVSPLVIGLTVVAYGTSTPELAVSVKAGLAGNDAIAVANVVGSNIFNVLFILGACALVSPLLVSRSLVRFDVPVMVAVSLAGAFMAWTGGRIVFAEGLLLVAAVIAYTVVSVRRGRAESAAATQTKAEPESTPEAGKALAWLAGLAASALLSLTGWRMGWFNTVEASLVVLGAAVFAAGHALAIRGAGRARDLAQQGGLVLAGLGVLVVGARWLVDASVTLAQSLGVSDAVIGLTIVAAGTSLPELATSIMATIRGQRDIAIGNVIGSNIYNILAILGVSSLMTPGGLAVAPEMLRVDIPVMLAVAVACLPVFYTDYLVRRWEGAVFFAAYLGYTAFLVATATRQPTASPLGTALAYGFAPLALGAFFANVVWARAKPGHEVAG